MAIEDAKRVNQGWKEYVDVAEALRYHKYQFIDRLSEFIYM